jgi:hypothetical protein
LNSPPALEELIMMQTNEKSVRGLAFLTGTVLAASALFHPQPAQAVDKSDAYKAGAVVLGAASAYMILKGKTLPGAVAGAGAYYAYKKGRKEDRNDDRYGQYPQYPGNNQYPNYSQYPGNQTYPGSAYPTSGSGYPTNNYPTSNYPSNSYPTSNYPTNYPSGGYNGGYNQYPDAFRATAPTSAAPTRNRTNNNIVLR